MNDNELAEINAVRRKGLRPQVVGCFVNEGKIFLFYDKRQEIWHFPQGGIDNMELKAESLEREMIEECGNTFWKNVKSFELIGEYEIKFPKKLWGNRSLRVDQGGEVEMVGKYYFIFCLQTSARSAIINETQFDDYIYANFDQANKLVMSIYQKNKREMYQEIIEKLHKKSLIK